MLKTLSESELVTYMPYEGVRLTPAGTATGVRVLRRHRLVEVFLSKTLDMSWDEVHEEAENLEHAVSDRLVDRIDARLGYPEVDPHGDPIPKADGSLVTPDAHALDTCQAGSRFRLARVVDQSPEFLRYLSETGLSVGTEGRVVANRSEACVVTIAVRGTETTLGHEAASKILVTQSD